MPTLTRDALAMGAGEPGLPAARSLARDGFSVAVDEARLSVGASRRHSVRPDGLEDTRARPRERTARPGVSLVVGRASRADHRAVPGPHRARFREDELPDGVWPGRAVSAVRVAADAAPASAAAERTTRRGGESAIPTNPAAMQPFAHPGEPGACGAQDGVGHSSHIFTARTVYPSPNRRRPEYGVSSVTSKVLSGPASTGSSANEVPGLSGPQEERES